MRHFCPDYYPDFKCIASDCRHSCCVGWEIDIDEDKLERYLHTEGPIGDRLRAGIELEGDAPHFRLVGKAERCPMLEPNGLCSLICALGEESLCQICRDHPRYRSFFSDFDEIGIGLSCEAAAEIIVKKQSVTKLIELPEDDAPTEPLTGDEKTLLSVRRQIFDVLQDRAWPIGDRVEHILYLTGAAMPAKSIQEWAGIFLRLERLEENWTDRLEALQSSDWEQIPPLDSDTWQKAFEQILVYFIYRHLPSALDDGMLEARVGFAVLAYEMLHALCRAHALRTGSITLNDLVEIARQYSAEIEYSDDNTYVLLDMLDM